MAKRRYRRHRNWRWYYRRCVRFSQFTWKHRYAAVSLILSVAAGILVGQRLSVGLQTQGIVTLSVLALCFVVWIYRHIGYGGIYIVRGLHPLTGKFRCIYVGLTERPPWTDHNGHERNTRLDEHIFGSVRYGKLPKVWADTAIDYYFVHESWYFLPGILKFFEYVNIKWRKPLYNDLMNHRNPDWIDKDTAKAQRAQRDRGIFTQKYLDALQVYTPFLMR